MASSASPPHRVRVRLETEAGHGQRFWDVAVTGDTLITRHGDVGTDGRETPARVFSSPAEAHAEARRRIAEKRAQGYRPVQEIVGEHACEPALLAAIAEAPKDDSGEDSEGAYLVYADWLQSQGDPRGELIMLDHGLSRKPHDARLYRAERAFWRQHRERMLPPRLDEVLRLRDRQPVDLAEWLADWQIEWKLGFVHKATVGRGLLSPPRTTRELLLALLDHPSGALLRELDISVLGPGNEDRPLYDYRPVLAALCEAAPAALRTLRVVQGQPGVRGSAEEADIQLADLGDVSGLFSSLPRLDTLLLRAGSLTLGDIRAPALRTFELGTATLTADLLASVDRAEWPRLETLVIDCHDQVVAIDALPALLAGQSAPALRRLALTRTARTRDVWAVLARSPVLGQLDELDLSYGDLGDGDVADMMSAGQAFQHLGRLVLDGNCISRGYRADVYSLGSGVSLKQQRGAAADLPRVTEADILALAPDARSILAAADVADVQRWPRLGAWATMVWGRYQGSDLYDVFVDLATMEAGCTCPSAKYPCKHALGLLRLCTRGRLVPVREPPEGLIEGCRASRYDDIGE